MNNRKMVLEIKMECVCGKLSDGFIELSPTWGFSHKTAKFPAAPFKPLSIGDLRGKIDFRIR
jgi:hypothetical protein